MPGLARQIRPFIKRESCRSHHRSTPVVMPLPGFRGRVRLARREHYRSSSLVFLVDTGPLDDPDRAGPGLRYSEKTWVNLRATAGFHPRPPQLASGDRIVWPGLVDVPSHSDVHDQSQQNERREHRRPSVAQQGKGDARDGRQTHHHSDIHQDME